MSLLETTKYLISLLTVTPDIKTTKDYGGISLEYLLVPEGSRFMDLDQYRYNPRRLREVAEFTTLESFSAYINKWGQTDSVMFCDINDKHQMRAIFDYHRGADKPAWKDHKAVLKAVVTPEWNTWATAEKKRMSQREFVHFLEDNAEDISKPDLAELLSMIREVQIQRAGGSTNKVSRDFEKSSSNKEVNIFSGMPDIIELGLRPWQYSQKYLVKARPFIHVEEGANPQFSFHLINIDRVREEAFNAAVSIVMDTGIQTYQ